MLLKELLKEIEPTETVGAVDGLEVTDVCIDSREAKPGSMFIAIRGAEADGHAYIGKAVDAGAVAVVCGEMPEERREGVAYAVTADTREAAGKLAAAFYGRPSERMKLIGVTGTNGKTTVATLLYRLLRMRGEKAGLVSTVCVEVDGLRLPAERTTPDAVTLNRLLARMADEGCRYACMEVSSHAVAQKRIAGLKFAGGIFTNLTRDHLDYHGTVENYLRAKKAFFDGLGKEAFCLVNLDDRNGRTMAQNTRATVRTYSLREMADFKGKILEEHPEGMIMECDGREVAVNFIGRFNAQNLLAVYGAALLLDTDKDKALEILSALRPVEGRMETVSGKDRGVTVVVDYAHTPDALENVIRTLREVTGTGRRILTVTGAGGNRDKGKRPIMAATAARMSDRLILTSDNPRWEEPEDIIADMKAGLDEEQARRTICITDRREAIRAACLMAQRGDVVLIAGKGHETYQEVKGVKHHFDDREEARIAIDH